MGDHVYLCTVILTWDVIKLAFVFKEMYVALIHFSEPQSLFRNLKKNAIPSRKY